MNVTIDSLKDNIKALVGQRDQGLAVYHQACGAIQLAEALIAQLSDALTEKQLVNMLENGEPQ